MSVLVDIYISVPDDVFFQFEVSSLELTIAGGKSIRTACFVLDDCDIIKELETLDILEEVKVVTELKR